MIDPYGLLERLMEYYASGYELSCPYQIGNTIYDTYAAYEQFNCFEHAFIRSTITLSRGDILRFREQVTGYIEPWLVRDGGEAPPPGHIYTYITGVFISERHIHEDVRRLIRRFRYYKGYGYYSSGYSQARIAAFDTETGSLICSPAARERMQEYSRILK